MSFNAIFVKERFDNLYSAKFRLSTIAMSNKYFKINYINLPI